MENLFLITDKNFVSNISRKLECQLSEWFSESINFRLLSAIHSISKQKWIRIDENRKKSRPKVLVLHRKLAKIGAKCYEIYFDETDNAQSSVHDSVLPEKVYRQKC